MKKHSVKRVIFASLAALLLSAIQPFVFMLSMLVCVAPIAIAVLYAWGGVIPAAILSAGTIGTLSWYASLSGVVSPALGGLGAAAALVLPGVVSIYLLKKRLPFFRRMLIAVGVQMLTLMGCVGFVYLVMRIDLVDAITAMMRESVEYMPQDMMMAILQNYAYSGMLTQESIEELTTGIVLYSDVMKVFDQVFELTNYQLKQILPGMLLGSGLISGVMMTAWPSLICVKRGDEPTVPHVPLYGWFLPAHLVGGMAICLIAGVVMQYMQIDEALAVTAVFSTMVSYLCIIQGMAAISRRFREMGASKGMRIGLIIAGVVIASRFVELYGMMSALFGRKGAISSWARRKTKEMEEMDDDRKDDDE